MKAVLVTLLAAAALLAATPATAQAEGQTEFTLIASDGGGADFHFANEAGERNPTLTVPAGATITITLKNEGGFHNLHVEGQDPSEYVENPDDTVTVTFTAPETGSIGYWCDPHKSTGMAGKIVVAGSETTPTPEEKNDSPGLGLIGGILALAGVALYARRQ